MGGSLLILAFDIFDSKELLVAKGSDLTIEALGNLLVLPHMTLFCFSYDVKYEDGVNFSHV
jgi:hypothetical protein